MPTDAPIAESSPAPVSLSELSSADLASWRVTGEKPTSTQDGPADSSPAPASDSPASTDASPLQAASEPAKGKGVKARSAELDADIAEMREKLRIRATLREELSARPAPDVKADSSPAPDLVATLRSPDVSQPMLTEEQFFATFPDVPYGQYGIYAARYVVAEDRHLEKQAQQDQQIQSTFARSAEAVKAEYPDYDDAMRTFADDPLPNTPANVALYAALVEQGNARVAYHLATHRDEALKLVKMSPTAALVALGKLDAQLSRHDAPVLKTVTDAPPPPPSIHRRANSAPENEIDAALAAGDFRRYKELANQRDIAAARGR